MNCKKGDLAVVVGSEYDGMVVTCVRFIGAVDRSDCTDYWQIDRCLSPIHTGQISDSVLRPIRNNPGDESFVTESRKSLSAPLERAKPAEVEA